jgi:hypothetical protein
MVRGLVNDKLKRIQDPIVTQPKYYTANCLEGIRTKEHFSQDIEPRNSKAQVFSVTATKTRAVIFFSTLMQQPTNAHLQRCLTKHYYSFHRHVSVTSVTIFRVTYRKDISSKS